jgi:hypothetical protein
MMSISPHCGQLTEPMSLPSSQNAGQIPCPNGTRARISKRPYVCSNLPVLSSRADVYMRPMWASSRTSMISEPSPSMRAFSVRGV